MHMSSTGFAASGHGWWVNRGCPTGLATVTVQLQQYFSDGIWRNRGAKSSATVSSGGGSGNWAVGRADCSTGSLTGWRSIIDVDLVLVNDPSGVGTTDARNVPCRVP